MLCYIQCYVVYIIHYYYCHTELYYFSICNYIFILLIPMHYVYTDASMIKSSYTNTTTNKHHHHHLSEELSLKCREYIQTLILRGVDFRREFDIYDTTYEGCILQTDFRHLLLDKLALNKYTNNINTSISNSRHESKEGGHNSDPSFTLPELERIENIYRDNKDPRKINYIRFIHNIHPRHYNYTQAYNNNNSITYNNVRIT